MTLKMNQQSSSELTVLTHTVSTKTPQGLQALNVLAELYVDVCGGFKH